MVEYKKVKDDVYEKVDVVEVINKKDIEVKLKQLQNIVKLTNEELILIYNITSTPNDMTLKTLKSKVETELSKTEDILKNLK